MTDYKGLVKKIRACSEYVTCFDCDIRNDCGEGLEGVLHDAADAIEALMPKRGEWVKDEEQSQKHVEAIYRCSACHNFDAWGATELYPYCPNCGAKMEVQDG